MTSENHTEKVSQADFDIGEKTPADLLRGARRLTINSWLLMVAGLGGVFTLATYVSYLSQPTVKQLHELQNDISMRDIKIQKMVGDLTDVKAKFSLEAKRKRSFELQVSGLEGKVNGLRGKLEIAEQRIAAVSPDKKNLVDVNSALNAEVIFQASEISSMKSLLRCLEVRFESLIEKNGIAMVQERWKSNNKNLPPVVFGSTEKWVIDFDTVPSREFFNFEADNIRRAFTEGECTIPVGFQNFRFDWPSTEDN